MSTQAFDPQRGRWVPAVPLPWFGRSLLLQRRYTCLAAVPDAPYGILTTRCCRKRFKTRDAYERHYRTVHLGETTEAS